VSPLPASIPSPPTNVLHAGPFTLHVYGLCYAVAVIAAVAITRRRWVAQGGSRELVYDVALWGFPAGLIGGRLYYLATTPGDSFDHWWGPLRVDPGGARLRRALEPAVGSRRHGHRPGLVRRNAAAAGSPCPADAPDMICGRNFPNRSHSGRQPRLRRRLRRARVARPQLLRPGRREESANSLRLSRSAMPLP
jgi:hypothetical protein